MTYHHTISHVPNTLSQLRKQIKRFKTKAKKNRKSLYGRLNKAYKKIDWKKREFNTSQIKEAIQDQNFKRWRRIRADKQVVITKRGANFYVSRQNLQGLCLLRQVCALMEDSYFNQIVSYNKKVQMKPFHFNSVYRGDIYLFSYPVTKEWKAELLTDFLHTKEFLFDEDSPHWKGMKKLRYFCLKNLMNSKVEKWEYQVQRFLAKKD